MMARALFLALIVPLSSVLAAQVDDGERPATPGTDGGQKDGAPQGSQGTSFGDSITPMPGSFPKETANSNFGDKLSDIETETVPEGDDEGVNGGLEDKPSGVIARLIAPAAGIVMEKADALGRSAIRSVRRKAVEKLGESLVENAEESVFNTVKNLRTYLQGSSDTPDDPANPDVTAVASEDDETQNGIGVHKDPSDSGSTEGHISAMTNQPMEKRNDEHEQNAQSTSDDVSNDLMHNDDQINRSLGDDPDGQDSGAAPPDQPSLPDKARRQVKSDVLGGAAAETSTSVPTLPGQTEINSEPPIPTTIPTKGTVERSTGKTPSKPVQPVPAGDTATGTSRPRKIPIRSLAPLAAISLAAAAYKTLPAVLATSSKESSPVPMSAAAGPALSRNVKMGGVLGAAVGIMALKAGTLFNKSPMKKNVHPAQNTKPPLSGKSSSTGLIVLASLMGFVVVAVASALALAYHRKLKNRKQTLASLNAGTSTDVDDIYAGEIDRV